MPATRPATGSRVQVRELSANESLRPFIDLAWKMNSGDPNWVPPLRASLVTALDRAKHPFHQHAEVAYFLAERGGGKVGRIAAILNRLHNEYHEDRVGFFGLFECEDDPEAAVALFDAASDWLRVRGCDTMRGPTNFSTNEEVASPGVLIEGFDSRPFLMMGHNPSYYADLHESSGFVKAKDFLAFYFDDPDAPPERGIAILDRILRREGVTVRPLDMSRFQQEIEALKEIYNAAWSKNWGFVPMTEAEFDHLAKEFRPIVDPDLCLIARTAEDEPIGFSLALPDLNEVFHRIPDGRLFPFGLLKLLWYRKKIRGMRFLTLGFKPKFHHAGLGVAFYRRTWTTGVAKGYVHGEASWILEDNFEMVRSLERMGGKVYRRYRVYEREI